MFPSGLLELFSPVATHAHAAPPPSTQATQADIVKTESVVLLHLPCSHVDLHFLSHHQSWSPTDSQRQDITRTMTGLSYRLNLISPSNPVDKSTLFRWISLHSDFSSSSSRSPLSAASLLSPNSILRVPNLHASHSSSPAARSSSLASSPSYMMRPIPPPSPPSPSSASQVSFVNSASSLTTSQQAARMLHPSTPSLRAALAPSTSTSTVNPDSDLAVTSPSSLPPPRLSIDSTPTPSFTIDAPPLSPPPASVSVPGPSLSLFFIISTNP